jgi:hypothetical protein
MKKGKVLIISLSHISEYRKIIKKKRSRNPSTGFISEKIILGSANWKEISELPIPAFL